MNRFYGKYLLGITLAGISANVAIADEKKDSVAENAKELEAVVVKGERIVRTANSLRLYPSKNDRRFAGGGIDVLQNMNVPEITVDPITKAVSTTGGQGAAMFIDFQPADTQQTGNIRPQDLERIDVLYSPQDPRFNNAPVAVNFILKKYEYGGYTKFDGNQKFETYTGDYSLYSKFSYKKMTYDVWGNVSYLNMNDDCAGEEYSVYKFTESTVHRKSITDSYDSKSVSPSASLRAMYNSSKTSIANTIGFNYKRNNPLTQSGTVDYSDIFGSDFWNSTGSSIKKGVSWNGNYYFILPGSSSLSLRGNFKWSENEDNSIYTLNGLKPITNNFMERAVSASGGLDYYKQLGSHSIGAGVSGGWNRNRLDYISSGENGVSYREGFGQAMVSANLIFNSFQISPSVNLLLSSKKVNDYSQTVWRPKAFVPFFLQLDNRQVINGSFEYAIGGPDIAELNPLLVRINEIEAVRGNEQLKNYNYYNASLGYNYKFGPWLSLRLDADFDFQDNWSVPVYHEDFSITGTPLMVKEWINNGSVARTTLQASLTGSYLDGKLKVRLTGSTTNYALRGLRKLDKWPMMFTANASYNIGAFMISAYYQNKVKGYFPWKDEVLPAYYYVSGAWSWNDLLISLRFSNPFRRSYEAGTIKNISPSYNSTSITRSPVYHQLAQLTISYSFGYGKKLNRNDEVRAVGDTESIILK